LSFNAEKNDSDGFAATVLIVVSVIRQVPHTRNLDGSVCECIYKFLIQDSRTSFLYKKPGSSARGLRSSSYLFRSQPMFSAQVHTYFFAVFAAAPVLITVIKSRIVQENISDDNSATLSVFLPFSLRSDYGNKFQLSSVNFH